MFEAFREETLILIAKTKMLRRINNGVS